MYSICCFLKIRKEQRAFEEKRKEEMLRRIHRAPPSIKKEIFERSEVKVKKQIKYICECCGVDYDTEEEAKNCEASHIKPVKIIKADYEYALYAASNLPVSIIVEFENGIRRKYFAKGRE